MEKVVRKLKLGESTQLDKDYWQAQSPKARIEAVTFLVCTHYGIDHEIAQRFRGPLTVTRRALR